MVLIDEYDAQDGPSIRANNSSAFNFRFIAGTGVLSNHSRGMACLLYTSDAADD